jgi:ubiquinone/menaquinone biosynthesis C-methylase UbiE
MTTNEATTRGGDVWSRWLLEKRFGGDPVAAKLGMQHLHGVRDRVLDAARIKPGDALLDVGAGDGLIAFGALVRVGGTGRVVFCEISAALLEHARSLAEEMSALDRCEFIHASANDLSPLDDESVDVVTTRSVLIYVKEKDAAFREFSRVLRPGGRISIWEPINSFNRRYEPLCAWPGIGSGIAEIADLTERLAAFFRTLQPDDDPMMDFDELDLLRHCEDAGFRSVRIDLTITATLAMPQRWDTILNSSGNPNIPSVGEAIQQIFNDEERARLEGYARPVVEAGGAIMRMATSLLTATKARAMTPEART